MSLATRSAVTVTDVRDAIVTALGTVPELTPSRTMPDTPTAGAAWPNLTTSTGHGERLNVIDVHEFDVLVILPAGYLPDTVRAADELLPKVTAALAPIGRLGVTRHVPIMFAQGETMPGFVIPLTPRLNARKET